MQKFCAGAVLLSIAVLVLFQTDLLMADPANKSNSTAPTLEQRVAVIEIKLANVERIMNIRLDDNATVDTMLREHEFRSALSQLQTIRSQLELYQIQHRGNYPDLSRGWGQLVRRTDAAGNVMSNSGQRSQYRYGPYLKNPPRSALTGSAAVATDPKQVSEKVGWFYVQATGEFRLVVSEKDMQSNKFSSRDVVVYH